MAQEAQACRGRPAPAQPQHHRVEVGRCLALVARHDVEPQGVALRVRGHAQYEGTEALAPRDEAALGEGGRAHGAVLFAGRRCVLGVAESEADRGEPAGGLVASERGGARGGSGHGGGV